ncbi:lysophospholipid acyltransferase family protein [Desulforhopalus vacuolatus]|uniref:lysophospholipid acyltransferase family protein n=1 Tax=Desulforhopalus vacuolatus TaxID=40414 RepID=UPI0019657A0E|nr:lysophospholipid acyltransferase family protein [Desulforhopalus vacuolatus]MBM9519747.1 lysophospholipid acyltransferase family protein [Desulforhopalus vacuolatus]
MEKKKILIELEKLGHWFFYMAIRCGGYLGGRILLIPVLSCYVLCSRKIHQTLSHYLVKRFPEMNRFQYFISTCRIVAHFGTVLVEQAWLEICKTASLQEDPADHHEFELAVAKGKGAVLLMAHVGNWQAVLSQLNTISAHIHILMNMNEQAAVKHYFELQNKDKPFTVIDINGPCGGILTAAAALRKGDLVVIMGDRLTTGHPVSGIFLNTPVRLPTAAYMLAATAEAPVIVILAANTGGKHFQIRIWDCFYPEYKGRDSREDMLQECAGRYLKALESYLQEYPFQWYNFYNFWAQ